MSVQATPYGEGQVLGGGRRRGTGLPVCKGPLPSSVLSVGAEMGGKRSKLSSEQDLAWVLGNKL